MNIIIIILLSSNILGESMKHRLILTLMLLCLINVILATEGSVLFRVRTVSANGQYAPRNIGAVWVTTSTGTFVKTIQRWGAQYLQYLTHWQSASGGNVVDAVTGATLNQHSLHNLTWDCTNTSGVTVSDGDYKIWVEFTENDGAGPFTSVTFTKGTQSVTLDPAAQTNFTNIHLEYAPIITNQLELISFTGVENPDHSVGLTWISASESNLQGYRVLRSTLQDISSATQVGDPVPGTNTSTSHTYNLTDSGAVIDNTYYYWLRGVFVDGSTIDHGPAMVDLHQTGVDSHATSSERIALRNYPNPFNPSTELEFSIRQGETATLEVYDILGNRVKRLGRFTAGEHKVVWDGRGDNGRQVSSGVYFCILKSPTGSRVQRMTLMK
jgi:flagellar hook assembly protein FlgD